MKKVIVALLLLLVLVGCATPNGKTPATPATPGQSILPTAEQTKTVAEDAMYYARVYYNLGKINEAQFKSIKDAYDALYVVQNQMIDARIAYLKLPTDASADEKFRFLMGQVMLAQQKLFLLAFQLGIVKEQVPVIPIRQ